MPLYEYRCLKCEHVMEVLQKLNDPPLRRCKVCSGLPGIIMVCRKSGSAVTFAMPD